MTSIGIKVDGLQALIKQLQEVGLAGSDVVQEVVYDLGFETKEIAIAGISGGAKSGRVYEFHYFTGPDGKLRQGRKRSKPHQASAPGQYPASDTGGLAGSVALDIKGDGKTATVGTHLMHGKFMEFGTAKVAARPWLLPSFERAKIGVEKELRARLEAKI